MTVSIDNPFEARAFFIESIVDCLVLFRDSLASTVRTAPLQKELLPQIHKNASKSIKLLHQLIITRPDCFVSHTYLQKNALQHLRFLIRTISRRPNGWTAYCEKLRKHCRLLCHYFRSLSKKGHASNGASTAACDESAFPDRIPFSVIQQQVLTTLNIREKEEDDLLMDSDCSVAQKWTEAFRVCGMMNIIHTVQESVARNKLGIVSSKTKMSDMILNQAKLQVDLMRSLLSQWASAAENSLAIEDLEPEAPVNPNSHLSLLEFDETESDETTLNCNKNTSKKVLILLEPVTDGHLRVPWSIEESIALWHGVHVVPGSESWSAIWKQSFQKSSRSPINLKDRWRVIKRNGYMRSAIHKAHETWVKSLSDTKHSMASRLIPIIVRQ